VNLRFFKLHSSGTDVIVVDASRSGVTIPDRPGLARAILKRRRGAGADALAIIESIKSSGSKGKVARLRTYLPGGEAAHADADALICAARYLFDSGKSGGERFELHSPAGRHRIDVMTASDFSICLGSPRPAARPMSAGRLEGPPEEDFPFTVLEADGRRVSVCQVELMRVYIALLTQDPSRTRLDNIESAAGAGLAATARAIVVRSVSRDTLRLRHSSARGWDGASAAGAALVAAVASGSADREAAVLSRGGVRYAEWNPKDGKVSVTAPADYVYEGEWYMPDAEGKPDQDT
jgi:diaminopimelate epimerase